MNNAYLDELEKLAAAKKPKPSPPPPPLQEFSPRYFGGIATLGASLYGAHKLGKLMKPPGQRQGMAKTASRRPYGMNPIYNLRGRGRVRMEGRSISDILQQLQERRPNRLMKDKIRSMANGTVAT